MQPQGEEKLIVVSGPSGAGKTTVLRRVFEQSPLPLRASVSATTRPPRPGERDGIEYHFLAPEEFAQRVDRGEFLECFEVFGHGYWYGTLWTEVTSGLRDGKWIVLDIDVHGAQAVVQKYPHAITIFVHPGSFAELERRLRNRGTETEDAIRRRLDEARHELAQSHCYRHQVVNDDLDRAVQQICDILQSYNTLRVA
jgi:guanylate kinase